MFPQGAQNVRCARCGHITAVPPAGGTSPHPWLHPTAELAKWLSHQPALFPGGDMAQLVCSSPTCRVVLMYPRGASQVQCSICGTVNCAMAVTAPILFLQALCALCACPCLQEAH